MEQNVEQTNGQDVAREVQGGVTPRLTADDFKVGERVEVFFAKGAEVRRWVPATVVGFSHLMGKSFVHVNTQWGGGDVDPTKVIDETRDTIFIRKMTIAERPLGEIYAADISPLIERVYEICSTHDIPFMAVFQLSRGGREIGHLVSSGNMHCDAVDPRLWGASSVIRS